MTAVSIVVPARDAAHILDSCLTSIERSDPFELIVVDGCSTDATREIARSHGATVISDDGMGLPEARRRGAEAATSAWVALVDADVILPDGAIEKLVHEATSRGYSAIQAGLHSISDGDYWGQALAYHHRTGRSRNWFGLVATVIRREDLLRLGFDDRFSSGEDIDFRWRLRKAGLRTAVSRSTIALHRFEGGFDFAKGQWNADGRGLARMIRTHGIRGATLMALPLAATARGVVLCILARQPKYIAYYLCYGVYNYKAIFSELLQGRSSSTITKPHSA